MTNLEKCANGFFKQSIIQTIIMLAEKIRGRESVINLLQYRYDEMMKHSYIESKSINANRIGVFVVED